MNFWKTNLKLRAYELHSLSLTTICAPWCLQPLACLYLILSANVECVEENLYTSYQLLIHIPSSPLCVPGQQTAVVEQCLLHVDASVLLCDHDVTVVTPPQLHWQVHVWGSALQRQAVSTKDQLPLGGDELEEGQLQRSIWKIRRVFKNGRSLC